MGAAHSAHKRDDKCIQCSSRNQGSKRSLPRRRRGCKNSNQMDYERDSPYCNHPQGVASEVVSP